MRRFHVFLESWWHGFIGKAICWSLEGSSPNHRNTFLPRMPQLRRALASFLLCVSVCAVCWSCGVWLVIVPVISSMYCGQMQAWFFLKPRLAPNSRDIPIPMTSSNTMDHRALRALRALIAHDSMWHSLWLIGWWGGIWWQACYFLISKVKVLPLLALNQHLIHARLDFVLADHCWSVWWAKVEAFFVPLTTSLTMCMAFLIGSFVVFQFSNKHCFTSYVQLHK